MSLPFLNNSQQRQISQQNRMPTSNVNAESIQDISGETLTLYYYNSGTKTVDAGQAAGTAVIIQLANTNICNSFGYEIGRYNDSSLTLGSLTSLTTEVPFPYIVAEEYTNDQYDQEDKLNKIVSNLENGDYCVDYEKGTIYGKKTTTDASGTASYKIQQAQSGGGGGIASDVNVDQVDGINAVQAPDAYGQDATGANTYATVLTPSRNARHISISLEGSNPAIVSLDGGTTDHFWIQANTVQVFDDVQITSGTAIQGKNGSAGNNYTNLSISIW